MKNLSANHRANDVIVLEDKEQILSAKFSYGPLDFALSGEKVDIFQCNQVSKYFSVVPQHDIFWPNLSVLEHLNIMQ